MRSIVVSCVLALVPPGCSGGSTDDVSGEGAAGSDAATADAAAEAAPADAATEDAPPDGSVDAATPTEPVLLRVLAFNDFHGQLEPTTVATPGGMVEVGGAAYLAMNAMGLDLNGVGNHEFDGVPVAFIGLTLRDTPSTTTPIDERVEFVDEVQTLNDLVPGLRAQGVEAIVVVLHQGGGQLGGPNDCLGLSGPIVALAAAFDPAVDVVVSGHTHKTYVCDLDGPLVSSAGAQGVYLTVLDLTLDRATGDVVGRAAENVLVDHELRPEPNVEALVATARVATAPLANAVVGRIAADLTRTPDAAGQSTLGAVVADAQLAATAGESAVAFMNAGGLRADLTNAAAGEEAEDGQVTFGEAFAVQPFNNLVVTMTLEGEQLHRLVKQQFADGARPLLVSAGFEYTLSVAGALGPAVALESIRIDGVPIDLDASYRITTNNFLASGGGGYDVFTEGLGVTPRLLDIDALTAYLGANGPLVPPALDRVHVTE